MEQKDKDTQLIPRTANLKGRKVLMHPDRDRIIKHLMEGRSLTWVETWLKGKYDKKQKRFQISRKSLQDFRKSLLGLQRSDIVEAQAQRAEIEANKERKRIQNALKKSQAYNEALVDVLDHRIDKEARFKQIDLILEGMVDRVSRLIDSADEDPDYSKILKLHNGMLKAIEQWRGMLQDYNRIIEKEPDTRTEHTININIFQEQIIAFKNIVLDILRSLSLENQNLFLERFDEEIDKLDKSDVKKIVSNKRITDVIYEESSEENIE